MIGQEYILAKGQEESEKLKEEVASGGASSYGDVEKFLEQLKQKKLELQYNLSHISKVYLGTERPLDTEINFSSLIEAINLAYTYGLTRSEVSASILPHLQYALTNSKLYSRSDETESNGRKKNPTASEQFFRLLDLIDLNNNFFDYKVLDRKGRLVDQSDKLSKSVTELVGSILRYGTKDVLPAFSDSNRYSHRDISHATASVISLLEKLRLGGWQPQDIILEKRDSFEYSLKDELYKGWDLFSRDGYGYEINFLREFFTYQ